MDRQIDRYHWARKSGLYWPVVFIDRFRIQIDERQTDRQTDRQTPLGDRKVVFMGKGILDRFFLSHENMKTYLY